MHAYTFLWNLTHGEHISTLSPPSVSRVEGRATKRPVPALPAYVCSPFLATSPPAHLLLSLSTYTSWARVTVPPHPITLLVTPMLRPFVTPAEPSQARDSHIPPPPRALTADCVRWLLSSIFHWPLFGHAAVCSHFLPPLFLEAISSRVCRVCSALVRAVWVAVVYLWEQGAVSPNKYTRGNGRQDLFDHILSKEIFESGSSRF